MKKSFLTFLVLQTCFVMTSDAMLEVPKQEAPKSPQSILRTPGQTPRNITPSPRTPRTIKISPKPSPERTAGGVYLVEDNKHAKPKAAKRKYSPQVQQFYGACEQNKASTIQELLDTKRFKIEVIKKGIEKVSRIEIASMLKSYLIKRLLQENQNDTTNFKQEISDLTEELRRLRLLYSSVPDYASENVALRAKLAALEAQKSSCIVS